MEVAFEMKDEKRPKCSKCGLEVKEDEHERYFGLCRHCYEISFEIERARKLEELVHEIAEIRDLLRFRGYALASRNTNHEEALSDKFKSFLDDLDRLKPIGDELSKEAKIVSKRCCECGRIPISATEADSHFPLADDKEVFGTLNGHFLCENCYNRILRQHGRPLPDS